VRIGAVAMGEQQSRRRAIRVMIVDDDPLFRLGVAAALAGDDQLEFVLSEAGDGEAALALIASEEPAVVLLDLNMPRLDGHAVARRLKQRWPHVRVIVLTGSDAARTVGERSVPVSMPSSSRASSLKRS